jgi:hypothetical protein
VVEAVSILGCFPPSDLSQVLFVISKWLCAIRRLDLGRETVEFTRDW